MTPELKKLLEDMAKLAKWFPPMYKEIHIVSDRAKKYLEEHSCSQ